MNRYLDTFRRHKIGIVLPVVLALFMSGWYATSVAPKYVSYISLWFDTQVPYASSINDPQQQTPADNGQQVLQEFIGSRQFLINVGHRGPLASYLATYHPSAKGPSILVSKLEALAGRHAPPSAPVDEQIMGALNKAFTVSTTGPQVVQVTMTSPYGGPIEPGTLNALAAEYSAEVGASLASRGQASIDYYQTQADTDRQKLASANQAAAAYAAGHPGATTLSDPAYANLMQAASAAQNDYASVQVQLQQATEALKNVGSHVSFHVLDPASSVARLSTKKKMIFDMVAGLLAGLLISILAVNVLTSMDKTARRPEDVDGIGGMEVVATIRQLPRARRLPSLKGAKSS